MKERINAKVQMKVQMPGDDGATHEIDCRFVKHMLHPTE